MPLIKHKLVGFTLTELMVALVLNTFVLAALISIFVGNLQHYRSVIATNRLNQEMQTAMELIANDIRRAGYFANASNDIGQNQNTNPFMTSGTDITVGTGNNCILLTYDRNNDGSLPAISSVYDDERYGYRVVNQVLQTRPWGAAFACNASTSAWENITDSTVFLITNLTFTLNTTTLTTGPGSAGIQIRSVDIAMTGQLASDSSITKTITQHVRVRNDKFTP